MRVAKWDNAKFVLIFLVVLGHLAVEDVEATSKMLQGMIYFIYLFHMPAFIFLAGVFSKKTVQSNNVQKVIPYLVLYLFMTASRFLVFRFWLDINTKFFVFSEGGVPWFAMALFFFYVITMVIKDWNPAYAMTVFTILGVMAGYDGKLGTYFAGMRVLSFYPFFLAGYYISVERLKKITDTMWVKLVSCVVLLGTLWISFSDIDKPIVDFLRCKYSYKEVDLWPDGGFYRIAYYMFAMLLIICILSLVPSKETIISKWGARSIQVFALHILVVQILLVKCNLLEICKDLWPSHYEILLVIVAAVVTIVLSLKIWEPFFKILMNPTKGGNKTK